MEKECLKMQPFKAMPIKNGEETKFIITCGRWRCNEETFDTQEEAEKYIEWINEPIRDWSAMLTAVRTVIELFKMEEQSNENISKETTESA